MIDLDAMISILLLLIANFTISWTRQLGTGWIRILLSVFAVLLLIPAFLFGFRALM
ncbi:hypothetical protein ACFQ49_00285 [Kroppenstedtia eburnea]|uniref:hypothetical protein n=1 Tax=Kroppenstedtia eburnea TaxID=714067 RepID=UPI00020C7914|nr:hypothetical protein [Kroppenstedtia eburnea]EGK14001.1 hypothetical protein HMPREF9374_0449 [Desmospora sp. 8437]QKI82048.1 hypothetical protein GXN75_08555 [Kroppenstedtia eburnea]